MVWPDSESLAGFSPPDMEYSHFPAGKTLCALSSACKEQLALFHSKIRTSSRSVRSSNPGALPLIHGVTSQAVAWEPLPELPGGSAPNTSAPGTDLGAVCCQPPRMVAPLGGEDSGGYCAIVTKQASE